MPKRVVLVSLLLLPAACGEPSSAPPTAPTATASLDVPPLPPPKPTVEKPVVRQAADDGDDELSPLPRDAAAAEAAFLEGKRALAAGDAEKARVFFVRSHRLDPAMGTLLNLALTEERLGMKEKAIEHYQRVVDEAQKSGRNDRAAMAKSRIDALKNQP